MSSTSRRGLRMRVSHRRSSEWQPPVKDEDLLYDADLGPSPGSGKKKKRRK